MDNQSRRVRCVVAVAVLAGAFALKHDASAQLPLPTAPPTASSPGCSTADASGQPATLFGPGDRVVVKGEGFGGVAAIRVTFVQGSRTLNVTTSFTDELGVFTADKPDAKIPDTAAPGRGEIHAFSTSKVAVCAVQIMAAAGGGSATPRPTETRSPLFLYWLAALVAFGLLLLVVIIRRWRARRLASAVGSPAAPEVPRLAEAPVVSPILPDTPELGPIFADEPPSAGDDFTTEPVREEAPLIDLIPQDEPAPGFVREEAESRQDPAIPEEPFPGPEEPPPAPRAPEPIAPARDDFEEFVFRDGKWRLRDQLDGHTYEPPLRRVDVADAREVADALHVPAVSKDASEPPLLDPIEVDLPEWWSEPITPQPRPTVEGTVSDTVARLVENTKDWTKR